jgi:hypothetical protein
MNAVESGDNLFRLGEHRGAIPRGLSSIRYTAGSLLSRHPNASLQPAMSNRGCATTLLVVGLSYAALLYFLQHFAGSVPVDIPDWLFPVFVLFAVYGGPFLVASLVSQWRAGRRADELRLLRLEVDDEEVRQLDQAGTVVRTIQLGSPFQYRDLYREDNDAIYRLSQGDVNLDFHTSDPESERVLTKILGLGWPPRGMRGAF